MLSSNTTIATADGNMCTTKIVALQSQLCFTRWLYSCWGGDDDRDSLTTHTPHYLRGLKELICVDQAIPGLFSLRVLPKPYTLVRVLADPRPGGDLTEFRLRADHIGDH